MDQSKTLPAPQPRLSNKFRKAIELRVRKGLTVAAACEAAGMSQSGYYKAMGRPAARAFYEDAVAQFVQESEGLRTRARIIALQEALHLMRHARSEAVKARMVELLTAGEKAAQVAINVDARQQNRGYEYPTPGAKIVEIQHAPNDKAPDTADNEHR